LDTQAYIPVYNRMELREADFEDESRDDPTGFRDGCNKPSSKYLGLLTFRHRASSI